jgi:four helix bundle protein
VTSQVWDRLSKTTNHNMNTSKGYRDLIVYKKAFALAMNVFHTSKGFPKEERYALTDQIRRSSRAVCSCIAEAYRKRQYQPYFVNKVSDADGENSETIVWLEFSEGCEYLTTEKRKELEDLSDEVGRMLNYMVQNPEKFLPKSKKQ